jgi:uncharacterized surface protein with fasciclin (FAS1) repeats
MKFIAFALFASVARGAAIAEPEPSPSPGPFCEPNIVDVAVATPNLYTLVDAVTAASDVDGVADALVDVLQMEGPYTVLAPTNAAFLKVPTIALEFLLTPAGASTLRMILLDHVIDGAVPASELTNGMKVTTVGLEVLTVTINDDGVFFDDAKVVGADISACNGIIHEIDSVLVKRPVPFCKPNVVDVAVATPNLSTLVDAVTAASDVDGVADALVDVLQTEGPFTVLAPTNKAFQKVPTLALEFLLTPMGASTLRMILLDHVVIGAEVPSSELTNGMEVKTAGGEVLTVTINDDGVFFDDAKVVVADIGACNGIIHEINSVLLKRIIPLPSSPPPPPPPAKKGSC